MQIGDTIILKNDSFGCKKGDKLLYLGHTRCSGYACFIAVIQDEHYKQLLSNNNCINLEELYKKTPSYNLDSLEMRLNVIKPQIDNVFTLKDALLEKERLTLKLEKINQLIKLAE